MAYKFQRGEAILSGALLQEGSIEIESGFEFSMHDELVLDTSRNLTVAGMSGSGDLQAGGAMTIAGNSDLNGTLDVSGDTKLAASGVGTQIRGDLTVDEFAEFNGGATFNTAVVEDLTEGRIVLAGAGGEIEDSGNLTFNGSQLSVTGVISGSSDLEIGGDVKLDGVADEALDVSSHSFYYRNSAGFVKRDTMSDYAAAIAGDALVASSGVLAVQVDDSGIEIDSDALRLKDSGVVTAKIADDAVTPAKMSLFDDSLAATDTHILIADGTDYSSFAMSGDATLSNAGVLTISADSVEGTMLSGNVADGTTLELSDDSLSVLKVPNALSQGEGIAAFSFDGSSALTIGLSASVAGDGLAYSSGVLSLDLHELTDDAVAVAADFIAFVDADDNSTKKESIADLVSAMAGAGLTATDGVLKVTGNDVHSKADGDTLQEGYNYFADASADASVNLPASPSDGDVVHVKAGDLTSDAVITISAQGSHNIDSETSIVLESPFAAVSLVYVGNNDWRIV